MWAAAPVTGEFKAPEDRLKLSRSTGYSSRLASMGDPMSYYISTVNVIVQERLLEAGLGCSVFRGVPMVGHKLESLILAQNERWRHA